MKKTFYSFLFLLLLAISVSAFGMEISVSETKKQAKKHTLTYPRLEGHENKFVEKKVNDAIEKDFKVDELLQLLDSGLAFTTNFETNLLFFDGKPDLLSVKLETEGKMDAFSRPSHKVFCRIYDLKSGEKIEVSQLFRVDAEAREIIKEKIEEWLVDFSFTHLDFEKGLSLPKDNVFLTRNGIILYDTEENTRFLSGNTFAFHLYSGQIKELLSERIIGAYEDSLRSGQGDVIKEYIAQGSLPDIPLKIGDELEPHIKRFKKILDDEVFTDGVRIYLEEARLRDQSVISRNKSGKVDGIILKRFACCGLAIGKTKQEDVIALFGKTQEFSFDDKLAEYYGIHAKTVLPYQMNGYELDFYFDDTNVLSALYLRKAE